MIICEKKQPAYNCISQNLMFLEMEVYLGEGLQLSENVVLLEVRKTFFEGKDTLNLIRFGVS